MKTLTSYPDLDTISAILLIDDIRSRVRDEAGCWIWQGANSGNGYGKIKYKGKTYYVHRLLYEALIGPVPEGLVLDHSECDRRECVNPYHLEPVTVQVNTHRGNAVLFKQAEDSHV